MIMVKKCFAFLIIVTWEVASLPFRYLGFFRSFVTTALRTGERDYDNIVNLLIRWLEGKR